mgnify:CR=1 FL=1
MIEKHAQQMSDGINSRQEGVIIHALKKHVGDDIDLEMLKPRCALHLYGSWPNRVYHYMLDGECILIWHEPRISFENNTLKSLFKYKIL